MSTTKELKVKISANTSEFSKATKQMSNDLTSSTKDMKKFATDVGKGLQDVGAKMTAIGVGVTASIGAIVMKGSEWSAQVEGQKFLYNNLDKAVQKSIDSNAKNAQAIGLTSQQYKNGATDISTYYKNMGLTAEATAELSGKTMDLVADLGAVKDVPFDEALGDFKSALMGNYEAVDKYGISLSASTLENSEFVKSLGKSWNQLSDNEKMMASYNEIVRQGASAQGLAKQEAESFGMKFKLLKQQISETVGEIGSNLLPVLEPLIQKFSEVATKVSEWVKENPKLTQTVLVIVGAIGALMAILGPIIALIGTLTIAVTAFNIATLPVTGTIALVIGAVVALIAIFTALIANWEDVKKACSTFVNTFKDNFNQLKEDMASIWESIKATTSNVWNSIKNFLSGIWNGIKTLCSSVFNGISSVISTIWNTIKSVTSSIWNGIKSVVSGAWNGIKSLASSVFSGISSVISSAWNGISSVTSSVCNGIKGTVTNVFNGIKSTVSNVMNTIKSTISSAWSTVKSIFSSVLKPNIKLPKISISGSFSLNPPSVPKFNLAWYSKGAIFKRPTVLGGMGVGDKHNGIGSNAEAILPINQLPKLLGLDKMQNSGVTLSIENFNNNTDRDIEYLVNELAYFMKRKALV